MTTLTTLAPTMADTLRGLFDWQGQDFDRNRLSWRWVGRGSLAASASTPDAGPVFATFLTPVSAAGARRILEDQLREGPARSIVVEGDLIDATPDEALDESITLIDSGD